MSCLIVPRRKPGSIGTAVRLDPGFRRGTAWGRPNLDIVLGGGAGHQGLCDLVGLAADRALDAGGDVRILLEIDLRILAALAGPHRIVAAPGAGLLDDAGLHAEI